MTKNIRLCPRTESEPVKNECVGVKKTKSLYQTAYFSNYDSYLFRQLIKKFPK